MQSDSNTSTQRNVQTNPNETSVDSSIAAFATETKHDAKGVGRNLSSNDKPSSPDESMQSSSVEDSDLSRDQRNAETVKQINPFFPADSSEMNSRATRELSMTLDGTRILELTIRPCSWMTYESLEWRESYLRIPSLSQRLSRIFIASSRP